MSNKTRRTAWQDGAPKCIKSRSTKTQESEKLIKRIELEK